jgi:S1-C subfamily serine protease
MRKSLLLVAAFIVVAVVGQLTINRFIQPAKQPVVSDKKFGSIVRLVRNDNTFCSGTVVSDHVIITAAHCVFVETPFGAFVDMEAIEIRDNDNISVDAQAHVIYATTQMDQAMLTGDFTRFEHRKLITSFHKLTDIGSDGQKFVSCGYPLSGDLVCTPLVFKHKDNFFWGVEGSLYPGMSGGPVMLPDGTLVGVNTAVKDQLSIVSPIYNLTQNLKKDNR